MFKVIETEEALLSAFGAGLLWYNESQDVPRPINCWRKCVDGDAGFWLTKLRGAMRRDRQGRRSTYCTIPEDFAVLVEEGDE